MKGVISRSFLLVAAFFASVCGGAVCEADSVYFEAVDYSDDEVYLGGCLLGVELGADGVIVSGERRIVTQNGFCCPATAADVKAGDIIIEADGRAVGNYAEFDETIGEVRNKPYNFTVLRDGKKYVKTIKPSKDLLTKKYSFGLLLKDGVTGVGTMTFVTKEGRFGALGHCVADGETGLSGEMSEGSVFDCVFEGAVKGERGEAGELSGKFDADGVKIGVIDKNTERGIFGKMSRMPEKTQKIAVASAAEVKIGKAYVYTTVNASGPQYYEIEIVKASVGRSKPVKNLVVSVTDKRLLAVTGGIVRGMSGSPIIQNGKLVGAVTHVFVNNPEKGYGLFIGNMLSDAEPDAEAERDAA